MYGRILLTICVFSLLLQILSSLNLISFLHIDHLNGTKCHVSDTVFVRLRLSIFRCASDCSEHGACVGFTYCTNKTCSGCSDDNGLSTTLDSERSTRYFRGNWFTFEGHLYTVSASMTDFNDGKEYCESLGLHIARIDSERESSFIRQHNWQHSPIWIGLTDEGHNGNWTWVYGGDVTNFTDWNTDPPDVKPSGQHDTNCVAIQQRFGYRWADRRCYSKFNVLCEDYN